VPQSGHVDVDEVEVVVADVARLLGCGGRNVRDLAQRGRIPGARRVGREWRFDRVDVVEYARSRSAAA